MVRQVRKIHVIGINSFEFEELSLSIKNLLISTKDIAVPINYFDKVSVWFEKLSLEKNFFKSKSNIALIDWLESKSKDVILISRGDPLWFGIGRTLLQKFDKKELNFYPANTCIQLAFKKIKKEWQDIKCISIHGRDTDQLIKELKSKRSNLAIIPYTKNNDLELIRKNLIELDLHEFYEYWILEELGFREEKIRKIKIVENIPENISNLSIAILLKKENIFRKKNLPLFGIQDRQFKTFEDRPNLLTKRDIRIQILADLELPEHGIIWDIGSGCGTIGLEALKLRPHLKLFSIDKRLGTKELIIENAKRLDVKPYKIIEKDINDLIPFELDESLISPNRIIIGGCDLSTKIKTISESTKLLIKGDIIVIPIITFEVLSQIKELLKKMNYEVFINLIQTYKSLTMNDGTRFEPNNPVYILKGKKI